MSDPEGVDSPSHTHARAILTVKERVAHIVGMMERLEWQRGKSAPELAEQWDLAQSTVEGHAAEAHRLVSCDKDELTRDITVTAREMLKRARLEGNYSGASKMMTALMDVSGARAPSKQELTGKDGERLNGPVIYVPPESDD